jgi:cytidyltransferase-like protein
MMSRGTEDQSKNYVDAIHKDMSRPPKLGPEPVLISRKEVSVLYEVLDAVRSALEILNVEYIVTGGSLLGAIRQHSILFCDDDIDIAILEKDGTSTYDYVNANLSRVLGPHFTYSVRPWEGGDRIRSKRMTSVFLDLFTIRKYEKREDLIKVIGVKKNGKAQTPGYINHIVSIMQQCSGADDKNMPDLFPMYHFNTRKAIEMWPKECYREYELFPLTKTLELGPLRNISGPNMPVSLLKRAFGDDCFHVYYQSASHNKQQLKLLSDERGVETKEGDKKKLAPLLLPGGLWEGGKKTILQDEHYIPMQPISRAKRKATTHNRGSLLEYLKKQEAIEYEFLRKKKKRPRCTVYMDGVFDLFHIGHLEAIKQCAELGDRVIIGVTGDNDAAGYKRSPIIPEGGRSSIIRSLQYVDRVICPCPLIVDEQFMKKEKIDLVVHGFLNDSDAARQEEFFAYPASIGKFRRIKYSTKTSTTEIIQKICREHSQQKQSQQTHGQSAPAEQKINLSRGKVDNVIVTTNVDVSTSKTVTKPQWFGQSVSNVTANSSSLPPLPYPPKLQEVVSTHVEKATIRRTNALNAIRQATGKVEYDTIITSFQKHLMKEGEFSFDTKLFPLRESLLRTCKVSTDINLEMLHKDPMAKDNLLKSLTNAIMSSSSPSEFQQIFDSFVRNVCAPKIAELYNKSNREKKLSKIYYQSFPCLRIVQPDEFSIGPHSDVSYGHHPCSINFYIPLTIIRGTSALHLESLPGAEDWHPIEGKYGDIVKHFGGAICNHWTTENKTSRTRVSLDVRLIPGPYFHALKCGGHLTGGQLDVYRKGGGYYSMCTLSSTSEDKKGDTGNGCGEAASWERNGNILKPDARVGYPFTVKNWDKLIRQRKKKLGI